MSSSSRPVEALLSPRTVVFSLLLPNSNQNIPPSASEAISTYDFNSSSTSPLNNLDFVTTTHPPKSKESKDLCLLDLKDPEPKFARLLEIQALIFSHYEDQAVVRLFSKGTLRGISGTGWESIRKLETHLRRRSAFLQAMLRIWRANILGLSCLGWPDFIWIVLCDTAFVCFSK
ncbi:hypothetical protein BDZ45DRAFT_752756 [Acephala macrosclerotiorum]|nr:hypothetical protein BDZ45DRAFT_752756 [Acephala macrosclerotiorum]